MWQMEHHPYQVMEEIIIQNLLKNQKEDIHHMIQQAEEVEVIMLPPRLLSTVKVLLRQIFILPETMKQEPLQILLPFLQVD